MQTKYIDIAVSKNTRFAKQEPFFFLFSFAINSFILFCKNGCRSSLRYATNSQQRSLFVYYHRT